MRLASHSSVCKTVCITSTESSLTQWTMNLYCMLVMSVAIQLYNSWACQWHMNPITCVYFVCPLFIQWIWKGVYVGQESKISGVLNEQLLLLCVPMLSSWPWTILFVGTVHTVLALAMCKNCTLPSKSQQPRQCSDSDTILMAYLTRKVGIAPASSSQCDASTCKVT